MAASTATAAPTASSAVRAWKWRAAGTPADAGPAPWQAWSARQPSAPAASPEPPQPAAPPAPAPAPRPRATAVGRGAVTDASPPDPSTTARQPPTQAYTAGDAASAMGTARGGPAGGIARLLAEGASARIPRRQKQQPGRLEHPADTLRRAKAEPPGAAQQHHHHGGEHGQRHGHDRPRQPGRASAPRRSSRRCGPPTAATATACDCSASAYAPTVSAIAGAGGRLADHERQPATGGKRPPLPPVHVRAAGSRVARGQPRRGHGVAVGDRERQRQAPASSPKPGRAGRPACSGVPGPHHQAGALTTASPTPRVRRSPGPETVIGRALLTGPAAAEHRRRAGPPPATARSPRPTGSSRTAARSRSPCPWRRDDGLQVVRLLELTRSSSPWTWAFTPLGPSSRMIFATFLAFSWEMPSSIDARFLLLAKSFAAHPASTAFSEIRA
ncbi:hypothetical protein SGLAM104S_05832 [Streptomyces glaucescens]